MFDFLLKEILIFEKILYVYEIYKTIIQLYIMDDNSKSENSLKNKWSNFMKVVFDPWVLCLLIITGVFVYFSGEVDNKSFIPLITLIISLVSGLLGGIIANRWAQMTELKVLVARGKSAVRSLKLVLLNISNVEKRTKEYINSIDNKNIEYKLIISNFEEVIEKCNILEEEIISSIENWTDIIPEVEDFKTQIGLISNMKTKQAELEIDILNLTHQITNVETEGTKQNEELQKMLADKETDLIKTKKKLKEAESKVNTSLLGGLTSVTNSSILAGLTTSSPQSLNSLYNTSSFGFSTCTKCGKSYYRGGIIDDGVCINCKGNPQISIFKNK